MAAIVVIDASSAINLVHGNVFEIALALDYEWVLGPLVRTECRDGVVPDYLDQAVADGLITEIDESLIRASDFLEMKARYGLGDGETECIVYASYVADAIVCSDDRKARESAAAEVGWTRVTGSLGILRLAVDMGLMRAPEAYAAVGLMKDEGAFLPDVGEDFFDRASER